MADPKEVKKPEIVSYTTFIDNTKKDKKGHTIAGYRIKIVLSDGTQAEKFCNSRELAEFEKAYSTKREGSIKWV